MMIVNTLVETCNEELLKGITFIEHSVARETVKKLIDTIRIDVEGTGGKERDRGKKRRKGK
jgi:hypothetical protein